MLCYGPCKNGLNTKTVGFFFFSAGDIAGWKKKNLAVHKWEELFGSVSQQISQWFSYLAHNLLEVYIISARPHYYHFLPCTSFFFHLLLFFKSPRTMPPFWMALFILHNSK